MVLVGGQGALECFEIGRGHHLQVLATVEGKDGATNARDVGLRIIVDVEKEPGIAAQQDIDAQTLYARKSAQRPQ